MPSKTEEYLALAQRTANGLTRYWESWTDYLTTASRLYKYPFADQLMIYAQRPDATACADFDIWNNRMNRYVRRGAKGIALLDESSGFPRLHYVFDVSDTGVRRNSRDPEVWQFNDDLKQPVSEMLAATYGISGERVSQQLADIAGKLVADYWDNNGGDIRAIVDGSLLMDYDEAGVEMQFKSAAAISVTYTLLERCGFEPAGWFDKDDFQAIYNFSTPDSVYALGAAVSDMSREVLRNIERTVKTTIRRRNAERSQYEYEQQERDLLDRRGLPAPEPNPEPAPEAAGQVRQAAPDVPERPSPGAVQHDAPEREPVSAPDGGGADGREPDAADHGAASEAGPSPGQSAESTDVGAAHEQSESTGRGTGAERTDLQLSFFDAHIPTEAKQIESIDQAESEKSPSAFVLSQAEIENALRRGSNVEGSKLRIWKIYQLQPDRKLRAKALANEYAPYGPGGSSHTYLDGSSGWLDHDSKGLTFEHYPDHQKVLLRWDRVEKYIDLMIQSDRYLSDKERRAIDFPLELNAASAAEYTALKAQHPDTLVGFEAGGYFMFYGEDAAKVAKVLNSALFTRETALGEVQVTGFPPSLWARKSKELWSAGNDVYLAGLNEDGTHHQTKHLHKEDYLPIGSIINMDGRKFRIDGVDFDKGKVSLQDMALADLRMPVFRQEPLAVVRELYEQQAAAIDLVPEKEVSYFNLRNEQRSEWSSKAQIKCTARDLSEVMQAVDYLKAHSLNTVEDLNAAIKDLNQTAAPLRRQLKQNENRMRSIAQIKDAAAVHDKLKPIHDTFIRKNFKLIKDAYAAQHKEELDAFNKAVRTLMKLNGSTTVNFSALNAEFSALQSGSAELRSQLEALQPDLTALKNIRKYIDMVLNKQQLSASDGKTPEKESVLKKLHEAKATAAPKRPEQQKNTPEL